MELRFIRCPGKSSFGTSNYSRLFNDKFFNKQWYLQDCRTSHHQTRFDLNVLPVWHRYKIFGFGIKVVVVDTGVQIDHPDLKTNYDPAYGYDFVINHDSPTPKKFLYLFRSSHGTECAGIIAMQANNKLCGVGIAPLATLGAARISSKDRSSTDFTESRGLMFKVKDVDVFNNSWGPSDNGKSLTPILPLTMSAIKEGIIKGRQSKGVIYVFAAGNGKLNGDTCAHDYLACSMYTITVAGVKHNGSPVIFSERCSNVLVSTTTLFPYCTSMFIGTSAAAPMVSGIVALILEANPKLSWREVQHVFAWTSQVAASAHNKVWFRNKAGFYFSLDFGFGLVDAFQAVTHAMTMRPISPMNSCILSLKMTKGAVFTRKLALRIKVSTNGCKNLPSEVNFMEHVQLFVSVQHQMRGAIQILLISPSGTKTLLMDVRWFDKSKSGIHHWVLDTVHLWGESPNGLWSIVFYDTQDCRTSHHQTRFDLNVLPVWHRYKIFGSGIKVIVVDDGVLVNHPDLRANYDPTYGYDFVINHKSATPKKYLHLFRENHGTECAGIIAMQANNKICGVGIAPLATLGAARVSSYTLGLNDLTKSKGLSFKIKDVDVSNNSWGPIDDGKTLPRIGHLTVSAIKQGITEGRQSKGVIYVFPAGNGKVEGDTCAHDYTANLIYTITVAGVQHNRNPLHYSERCSNILVTVYSGTQTVTTTSQFPHCTNNFSGTSAAAPIVSGIAALILEANSKLTWREVQHVFAWTSQVAALAHNKAWFRNKAGFYFSLDFGFGLVDAFQAVTHAMTMLFTRKLALRMKVSTNGCKNLPSEVNYIEHVQLLVSVEYPRRGAIQILLISPSGTQTLLMDVRWFDKSKLGLRLWVVDTVHLWGESPEGLWSIVFYDTQDCRKIRSLTQYDLGVVPVWYRYRLFGSNIKVMVVDTGLQTNHPDLKYNYDPEYGYDVLKDIYSPKPRGNIFMPNYSHGTNMAGIIGMQANNKICGVGIAPLVTLGAIRLTGSRISIDKISRAITFRARDLDVSNNSWSFGRDGGKYLLNLDSMTMNAFKAGIVEGRRSKGLIFIFPSGNGKEDGETCAHSAVVGMIYTITVAGVNHDGSISGYSQRCSNILVTAYSGDDGIGFIGITWREVHHVLVWTSEVAALAHNKTWSRNEAGFYFSPDFGLGLVDAFEAVTFAMFMKPIPPMNRTKTILMESRRLDRSKSGLRKWVMDTVHLWGESPPGKWSIIFYDTDPEFGYDFLDYTSSPEPKGSFLMQDSHGTKMAGIIGMQANNKICGVGIAPLVTLGAARVTHKLASNNQISRAIAFRAMDLDVSNNSWVFSKDSKSLRTLDSLNEDAFKVGIIEVSTSTNSMCNSWVNGTSAATAMVSGIVALILEANINLTWREVHHVLAWTSQVAALAHNETWSRNKAGFYISLDFGFGLVDAFQAVTFAMSMEPIAPMNRTKTTLMESRRLDRSKYGLHQWVMDTVHLWGESPQGEWSIIFYDTDSEYGYDFVDDNPFPTPRYQYGHATKVAGVIAMQANNNICGVGIAPLVTLGALTIYRVNERAMVGERIAQAFWFHAHDVDISNNSWGENVYAKYLHPMNPLVMGALKNGIIEGRQTKGTIFIFSSGNNKERGNTCAHKSYANSIYTITVGGIKQNGDTVYYSERCSNILVAAYSSGLDGSCEKNFLGTSAAVPMVSGIVALILEARYDLSWREVQHALVWTSQVAALAHNNVWFRNKAGFYLSPDFGFGVVDAFQAVTFAKTMQQISPMNRTQSLLMDNRRLDKSSFGLNNWIVDTVHFWGERPQGIWSIIFYDTVSRYLLKTYFNLKHNPDKIEIFKR
ncbi:hypothetical protein V9T40_006690 [Parthenolecanium corni]|uniref:P/Homo B domain-containing protein n=1 Tax=Parthenolecanium corni TaxID=536013 RepID=A0AAN9TTQ6_9HEMI